MNKKNYFPYNDFTQYRSSLILPISGSQISSTFADLRSMVTSFRDVLSENDKKEINEGKVKNEKINNLNLQMKSNNDIYSNPPASMKSLDKKSSTGKIETILSNMHIFLNNNLTEIKDLKSSIDGMIKTQNDNNTNSDETYDLVNNDHFEKKHLTDRTSLLKKSLTDKTSTHQKTSNDPIDEEYIALQKKIHQKELDKLIDKIKSYEKRNKNLENELTSKKEEQQRLLSELNEHLLVNLAEVSNPIEEEIWVNNMDKSEIIKELAFSSYYICFDMERLCFYSNLSAKNPEFYIELIHLNDLNLNYIKNDNVDDNLEVQLFTEEETNDVNNYKIPHGCILKNNSNQYIFIKFSTKMDYIKFEGFFLILEIRRKSKKIDFFLNNMPLNNMFSKCKEDPDHLSPSNMRKINLSHADMEISIMRSSLFNDKNKFFQNRAKSTDPEGGGVPANRSSKNKKTLIGKQFNKPDSVNSPSSKGFNFEKSSFGMEDQLKNSEKSLFENLCVPKKNSENFNLEDFSRKEGKKKNTEKFVPEDFYKRDNRKKFSEKFSNEDQFGNKEKKKQYERISPDFLPKVEKKKSLFHSKTQHFEDQIFPDKQNIPEKNVVFPMEEDEKYLKALKIMKNGFVFMKYGKFGKPHERIVYINSSDKVIEWKAFNKKKGKGKIEIDKIVEIKEGRKTSNFLKTKSFDASSDFLAFSIIGKNRGLDLVAENEKMKEKFLNSLKVIREKREEDMNRIKNTGSNNNNSNNNNDRIIAKN